MKLTHLGTESGKTGCPMLLASDRGTFVVQGWRLSDPEALSALDIPAHETVVEVPAELMKALPVEFLRQALAERESTARKLDGEDSGGTAQP
ncbi:hypothetical protein [Actinomadura rupiterrae]|uniref:hypothetical protein n=1 Tax=Actinomadura rupiterrae TaxID=559627 RepID=UPI0020A4A69F|nr:hypothetical protein [Actinomadura rupiterrae]MCP2343563.1 hypothetical protein [Actinomadura rupiterrae]